MRTLFFYFERVHTYETNLGHVQDFHDGLILFTKHVLTSVNFSKNFNHLTVDNLFSD